MRKKCESTYSEYLFWLRECESTKQAKAYAELKSVRVIWKKCEARIPNTCFGCESAKHEAGESLCRVEKRKSYLEEVRSTDSEYLF